MTQAMRIAGAALVALIASYGLVGAQTNIPTPKATTTVFGKVIPGTGCSITTPGVLDCAGTGAAPAGSAGDIQTYATSTTFGTITPAAGIATFLATPSGTNLASALTTALPATKGGTGLTSLGTGVATALGVNTGSAGAVVLFNGAGGSPSSLTGTNITGTAAGLTAGAVTTNANLTGPITSVGNATSIAAQTGTGTTFVMSAAPTLTGIPVLGAPIATSLALGGATIGANALAVTGATALGNTVIGAGAAITSSGAGGALGTNAFSSTAYAPLASPTFTGTVTAGSVLSSGAGTASLPSLIFGTDTGAGWFRGGVSQWWFASGTIPTFRFSGTGSSAIGEFASVAALKWDSSTDFSGSPDLTLSRSAAGVIQIGGASKDATGSLLLTNITASGTTTIAAASDATHTDATVCRDTTTGVLYAGSGAVGICLGTSSLRFKTDIGPLAYGLDELVRLETIHYRYKPGYGDGPRELFGFAAEQVNEVMPKLVGLDAKGLPNSVDWAGLMPIAVRSIQQLNERLTALERRNP